MEIEIRSVELRDAERVADLSGQLGYPCDADGMQGRIRHVLASTTELVLVAAIDERVVAWIHVSKLFHLESGKFAEIVGLVVDETLRGGGIGSLLVQKAQDWAVESGLHRLVVRSNVIRKDTHRFYANLGFRDRKEQKYFLLEL